MNKKYNILIHQYNNIENEIDDEIENLIYLLNNIEIENIDLYNIYLKIKDLLFNKKLLKNKIVEYKIDNNIDDELYEYFEK